jgi:hypothetical protein
MTDPTPTTTPLPAAPTPEAAAAIGAQGGPPSEAEHLAFEAWMQGHSWPVAGVWDGTTYNGRTKVESDGWFDTTAMQTRMLWAAWRDRAALATPPAATREAGPLPGVAVDGVPCDFIRTMLRPAYEPGDGTADGAQLVSQAWWHPIMGCDSLQIVVDNARAVLASRGGAAVQPKTAPTEEDIYDLAEVFNGDPVPAIRRALELWGGAAGQPVPVAFIHRQGDHWEVSERSLDEQEKACGWTQEPLYSASTAVQPVAVSERLPGPEDCDLEGRCWLCGKVEGDWRLLSVVNPGVPHLKYCFSHWLPHWALPVPAAAAEGEVQP